MCLDWKELYTHRRELGKYKMYEKERKNHHLSWIRPPFRDNDY